MFRTLIVPLDGSKLAEQALPYAVRLAQADEGRIILMRGAVPPAPDHIEGATGEKDRLDAVTEAEKYLAKLVKTLGTRVPAKTLVTHGRPAPEILKLIVDESADGVVMATRGRTGLPHLMVGSVAESILAQSPVPVFLVHSGPDAEPPPAFDPLEARLIVPLDGSSFAETALEPAIQVLGPAGELVLVCITHPPEKVVMAPQGQHVVAYLDQQEEAHTREAHGYLDRVATQLRATYPVMRVSVNTRVADDAGTGIVQLAAERAADLVVMATHGRTGVRRAVVGSVAGRVLRMGHTPLLLVGPAVAAYPSGRHAQLPAEGWLPENFELILDI